MTIFPVAGILAFRPPRLGSYSVRATASYSYEGQGNKLFLLLYDLYQPKQKETLNHQHLTLNPYNLNNFKIKWIEYNIFEQKIRTPENTLKRKF